MYGELENNNANANAIRKATANNCLNLKLHFVIFRNYLHVVYFGICFTSSDTHNFHGLLS